MSKHSQSLSSLDSARNSLGDEVAKEIRNTKENKMTDEALYESLTQQIQELDGDGILVHDGDEQQYERVMARIKKEAAA